MWPYKTIDGPEKFKAVYPGMKGDIG